MASPASTIVPAATVIVMRDAPGEPDVLIVERAAAMSFAGGALVFPGGRVDPGDHALARTLSDDPDEMAHRVAAIRETLEEAGVAVGLDAPADALEPMRAALHDGTPFGTLLREAGATLDLAALVPFARWLPDHAGRVFDTRFYLARLPKGAPDPTPDDTENVRVFWAPARSVLADADAGRARVIYPTRRNLERLAAFACYDDAVADARAHPVRTITPWVERRDDADHLCIPTDAGYPVTSEPIDSVERA